MPIRLPPVALALAALLLAGLSLGLSASAAAPAAPSPPAAAVVAEGDGYRVRHETLRLPNGLQVILVEDHRLPLVAFNLWVHAGPQNEAAGQTGFAHLFEHLVFAGTRHIPRGEADRLIDAAGGTDYNGSTNFDRTNYYFTLPSNQLELGLWIQADMLGYMIDQVDALALATQQDVVRNERRETTENRPYGVADEAVYQALYPEGHPYRAAVIGSHADIQSIRLQDVRDFARTYYRPNNATLVLAGDFDAARARTLLRRYFGTLRSGEPVPPVALPPAVADVALAAERRVVVPDRIELPRLTLAWHSAPAYRPGDAELQVAAGVLGGDKSSRLYRKLVYERQIAQSVTVVQSPQALGSVFAIEAVARPGHTLQEIEAAIDEELAALAATPPGEAEVRRARRAIETRLFGRLETVGGLADLLNEYNQLAGDADYLAQDLARFRAVTPQAVQAAVVRSLPRSARVAVLAQPGEQVLPPEVPTPPLPEAAAASAGRESINADEPWRRRRPAPGPARPLALPAGERFVLPNGLAVVRVARPGVPLVSAALVVRAGQDANPPGRPGLAGFTAALLEDGTATRSATEFAEQVANLGATLTAGAGREDARIEFAGLRSGLAEGLALVADAARHPAFDAAEIERRRASRRAALLQQRENAHAVSVTVAQRAWYGEGHPLGASALGDEAALAATSRDELLGFWRARFRPDRAALVVAGDVGAAELRALATRLFGGWRRPEADGAAALVRTPPPRPSAARLVLVDKPGTPQTALALIGPGPRAADPQVGATQVMNAALGGLFTSRINQQLRELKGYTYGMSSGYTLGRDDGLFAVRGSVRTPVTGAALADLFKELDGIRARPLGAEELARARNSQLLSLPGEFDTHRALATAYADAWSAGLPADHVVRLPARYAAVTAASAFAAARAQVEPSRLIVVAVGDRAQVQPQLEALGRGPIELRDADGRPLPAATAAADRAVPSVASEPAASANSPGAAASTPNGSTAPN